jgi:acetyltransferase-like isoleucine patch superfamily enzyme
MRGRWWSGFRKGSKTTLRLGEGSWLAPGVQILGAESVMIGSNTVIGEETWINVNHGRTAPPAIQIGDNVLLGRRNFLSSGGLLIIRSYCLTGLDCQFIGSDHCMENPFIPYISSGATSCDDLIIGVNCWIGSAAKILRGVSIGHGSVVGAGSVVTKSVPPFSIAVGNPARVIKRFSTEKNCWVGAGQFTGPDSDRLPPEDEYLEILSTTCPLPKIPKHAAAGAMGSF